MLFLYLQYQSLRHSLRDFVADRLRKLREGFRTRYRLGRSDRPTDMEGFLRVRRRLLQKVLRPSTLSSFRSP